MCQCDVLSRTHAGAIFPTSLKSECGRRKPCFANSLSAMLKDEGRARVVDGGAAAWRSPRCDRRQGASTSA